MIDLSIIIVSYNSAKEIKGCLDSLHKSPDRLKKEVIVIDNASTDNSLEIISKHPLKPIIIKSQNNVGFSKAVNQGIKRSTGNYVLLLNPDTKIIGSCLSKLVDFAKNNQSLGAVAPRLLNPDGKPQASVSRFPTILNAIKRDFFGCKSCFGKYLPPKKTTKVDVAVMAAFLIPRSTIETVGLLDERFFLYYEDIEYCRRLRRFRLPIYYLPSAQVKHVHGASGNFVFHLKSPLLSSAEIYHGRFHSNCLNLVLWIGHKWQVILRGKKFRD